MDCNPKPSFRTGLESQDSRWSHPRETLVQPVTGFQVASVHSIAELSAMLPGLSAFLVYQPLAAWDPVPGLL